ncbi:dephospho-CoA kinase domain-containing protein [Protopterus annectens]|uniref:dephospho-CoA kinase domain-containing protein n=1 Tax=Protopterus annectens TaxID=7888 RepID=UPI001CFAE05D|nr:dephospho-CoA kinase domain-containing protein [Protopterus annectens]XP_043911058.1 dephospho-CoA kinase domain-containing protein [Protopterus annectens]XP_043911059.1 dephospho-CoA kinase domain-containing protein [Protopterus annectens]
MFLVGLTGGIASGKSTVATILRELGCPVIDADIIARQVVEPGTPAHQLIVQYFGTEILLENGQINREMLGNIIFSDEEKRRRLNSITHPAVLQMMLKQILKYFFLGYRYVILDVPLLFETNKLRKLLKRTVVVYCDPQTQISRFMRRNNFSRAEVDKRLSTQMPLEEKRKLANHVIDNSGDLENTRRQVLQLHSRLEESLDFLLVRIIAIATITGISGLLFVLGKHFLF